MNTKVKKIENKKDAVELFLDFMFKNKVIKKFFKLVKKSNYEGITSINLKDDKIVLKTEDGKCLIVYQDKSIKEVTDDFINSEFERDPDKFITITKDLDVYLSVIKLSDYDNYFESSELQKNKLSSMFNLSFNILKPFYQDLFKLLKNLKANKVISYTHNAKTFEEVLYTVAKNKKLKLFLNNDEIYKF